MRLVLDTSVIVSAVRSPAGVSFKLLEAGLRRDFVLLLSSTLVFEYEAVLLRPEQLDASGSSAAQIDELLFALLRVAEEVRLGQYLGPTSSDISDDHVLSLAMQGDADAIVTYNTKHFAGPARQLGVNLWTAAEALRSLRR